MRTVLLDMNLSPSWVEFLREQGIEAVHWSSVGDPRAKDAAIMEWAREHDSIAFTPRTRSGHGRGRHNR